MRVARSLAVASATALWGWVGAGVGCLLVRGSRRGGSLAVAGATALWGWVGALLLIGTGAAAGVEGRRRDGFVGEGGGGGVLLIGPRVAGATALLGAGAGES